MKGVGEAGLDRTGTQARPPTQPDTRDTATRDLEKLRAAPTAGRVTPSQLSPPPQTPHPQDSVPIRSAESTLIEDQEESSPSPAETASSRADSLAVKASEVAHPAPYPYRPGFMYKKHSHALSTGAKANPKKSAYVCKHRDPKICTTFSIPALPPSRCGPHQNILKPSSFQLAGAEKER